jgi:serine/threonine protein kinase
MLVKSLEDSKLYIRKDVFLDKDVSKSGIPNEIEFNPSHPLIPHVTKHVDSPHGEYYWTTCTEYCDGGDLRKLYGKYKTFSRYAKIPEGLIWKFYADMIKILDFLHREKIFHQDVYPQNIFMQSNRDKPEQLFPDFVLGDFG